MIKNKFLIVIFYSITITLYANGDYYTLEDILVNRGYTKFDPEYEYADYIYNNFYCEIFNDDFKLGNIGFRRVRLNASDGFEYSLYYIFDKKDLPNILTVVYLKDGDKVWGFYKKNYALEGKIIYIEATEPEDYILVFF